MASGAEDVAQAAQAAITQNGQTVGNALQAYHMASATENARAELEMQKSNHEMNKTNWLAQQVKAIHDETGPAKQLLIKGLNKNLPSVMPEANLDFPENLKDQEFSQGTFLAFKNVLNGTASPEDYQKANSFAGAATPQQLAMSKELLQAHATIEAGKAKQQGFEDRITSQQITSAQGQVGKIMTNSQFDQMAEGSIRTRKLIDNAMNETDPTKKVARTQQLLTTLAEEQAKLVSGKSNFSESTAEGIAIRQSDATLSKLLDQLRKGSTDVKTLDAKLQNARNEVNELGGSYVNAIHRQIDAGAEYATDVQAPTWAKAKGAVTKKYGAYFNPAGNAVENPAAPTAPPPLPPPTNYGADVDKIKANYKRFQADKAHQEAGEP